MTPAAGAATPKTLTVDDDGAQCPAAEFNSVQNAIYAAAAGDTVAVCPGTYVEGGGGVGSNGLIIVRDVNIKGAGADLVTIKPRRTTASGGQIAETSSPSIRNAVGDVVMIDGDSPQTVKTHPLTVNLSGVTIDGDGVYAEAGVVFRDAQGRITRSRVTNIVTTEKSYDTPRAGEYKGSSDGVAVASVSAPGTPAFTATPRLVTIVHRRRDKYNSTGVLLDGATGDTVPLTASGVTTQGTLSQNQIVGRTLCVDFLSNGNCASPAIATNGPLYGQDGVRVTAGSSAVLTNNTISQNLVQGTLAPVRNSATNNVNLAKAADVRLVGAAASLLTSNNFVDSSYGVINVALDGTTANTAVPVQAENNWWGLRTGTVTTNPGPAISPATNPPVPESPVNGAPVTDGAGTSSDAVDFYPYRNGFQSDPYAGEFPTIDVPGPVDDLAPTVAFAPDSTAAYHRGGTIAVSVTPGDDFGVHSVRFYDGAAMVGELTHKPYTATIKIPSDVPCAPRTLVAVVEDSAGQTASAARAVPLDPADCAVLPAPAPPSLASLNAPPNLASPNLAFLNPPSKLGAAGRTIRLTPATPSGVKAIDVFLGTRKVCTIAATPYQCSVLPTGADVGIQSLRAVLTDLGGRSAEAATRVLVSRFKPKSLSIVGSRDRIGGRLRLPDRVTAAQGCKSGTVTVVIREAGHVARDTQSKLSKGCTYSVARPAGTKHPFQVIARFGGNTVLLATNSSRRFS